FDTMAWADRILFYSQNPEQLAEREQKIRDNWKPQTWLDSSEQISTIVLNYVNGPRNTHVRPTIWFDMTTSYAQWRGGVSGIIRTELVLAKYIYELAPNVKFFAFHGDSCFVIPNETLGWLFDSDDINKDYKDFQAQWSEL